jgi:asparagine synthase (glutamine-hydrolysing)
MCGINGILSAARGAPDRLLAAVGGMNKALAHRGPDGQGEWSNPDGTVVLGHRRLSIIDLSQAAAQPMVSDDGLVAMTFNGEVYNFRDLRLELQQRGYTFHSHGDSEVVLKAFHCWGADAFRKFNGMYAVAFFDARTSKVFLVRDRLGIKPLHYAPTGTEVVFSSEIKGIAAAGLSEIEPSYERLHEFLYFGNTLGEPTLFRNIRRVLPGHYVTVDLPSLKVQNHCYWSASSISEISPSEEEGIAGVRDRLEAAVHRQLVSDVPVGLFLSGGVDSTAILAFASKHSNGRLRTYTAGFDHLIQDDETFRARASAEMFGSDHEELHVTGADLLPLLRRLVAAHDMPFSDAANIPLLQLCGKLNGRAKVVLQGDGGDELFGGYNRYEILSWMQRLDAAGLKSLTAASGGLINRALYGFGIAPTRTRILNALIQRDPALRMAMLLTVEDPRDEPISVLNQDLRQTVSRSDPFLRYRQVAGELDDRDPPQQMLLTDLQIILPDIFLEKVDRSTMAESVEVRVPFLDHELVDYVAALPSRMKLGKGRKKHLLRQALRGIVPDDILDAPKMGFGTPFSNWMKGPLSDSLVEIIQRHSGVAEPLFDAGVVSERIRSHRNGERDFGFLLWKCLQLALWLEYVEQLRKVNRIAAVRTRGQLSSNVEHVQ